MRDRFAAVRIRAGLGKGAVQAGTADRSDNRGWRLVGWRGSSHRDLLGFRVLSPLIIGHCEDHGKCPPTSIGVRRVRLGGAGVISKVPASAHDVTVSIV